MSSEDIVDLLLQEILPDLRETYLDRNDIKQEIRIALVAAGRIEGLTDPLDDIREYVRSIIKKNQFECWILPAPISVDSIIDRLIQLESKEKVKLVLTVLIEHDLTPVQSIVLKLLYGFWNDKCHDHYEISQMCRLSVQRIEEIEREAIAAIKRQKKPAYVSDLFANFGFIIQNDLPKLP